MRLVDFIRESIQQRQYNLIQVIKTGLCRRRRKTQLRRKVQHDVRRLVDEQVAVLESWSCENGGIGIVSCMLGVHERRNSPSGFIGRFLGVVGEWRSSLFKEEADEFAAPRETGPVDELVGSVVVGFLTFGIWLRHGDGF